MEKQSQKLLKMSKDFSPEPNAYMATRVLAEVRKKRSRKSQWLFAGVSALVSSMATLTVVLVLNLGGQADVQFMAQVEKPYVVKLEVAHLQSKAVAEAEIVLAQGVLFHSEEYAELEEQRSLVFSWPKNYNKSVFPFVIKGSAAGEKPVTVRFYDQDGELVEERKIVIRFERSVG